MYNNYFPKILCWPTSKCTVMTSCHLMLSLGHITSSILFYSHLTNLRSNPTENPMSTSLWFPKASWLTGLLFIFLYSTSLSEKRVCVCVLFFVVVIDSMLSVFLHLNVFSAVAVFSDINVRLRHGEALRESAPCFSLVLQCKLQVIFPAVLRPSDGVSRWRCDYSAQNKESPWSISLRGI